jgi:hypothetical protein
MGPTNIEVKAAAVPRKAAFLHVPLKTFLVLGLQRKALPSESKRLNTNALLCNRCTYAKNAPLLRKAGRT